MRSHRHDIEIECLGIIGSRSLDPKVPVQSEQAKRNKKRAFKLLDSIHARRTVLSVVSGGGIGPDTWGEEWAELRGIPCWIVYPDWNKHGRAAGFIRNGDIMNASSRVIAFWDGSSKGTTDSLSKAKKLKIPRKVIIMQAPIDEKYL